MNFSDLTGFRGQLHRGVPIYLPFAEDRSIQTPASYLSGATSARQPDEQLRLHLHFILLLLRLRMTLLRCRHRHWSRSCSQLFLVLALQRNTQIRHMIMLQLCWYVASAV